MMAIVRSWGGSFLAVEKFQQFAVLDPISAEGRA
jgi:hypothetical protein